MVGGKTNTQETERNRAICRKKDFEIKDIGHTINGKMTMNMISLLRG